jgi:hypothetical protein
MAGSTYGGLTARAPLGHGADAWALSQGQEGLETFDQRQSTVGRGRRKTAREWLAGAGAQG